MNIKSNIIPIASTLFFMALVIVGFIGFFYESKREAGIIIADDVKKLQTIFQRIHDSCVILSFDYEKNPINYLTVVKFVSSEIGSMNLAHPKNWQGPYVQDNPQIQGKEYQILRTKKGHFIVPGQRVKLPSGKIIGKDLILDENSDIHAMIRDKKALMFSGKALAAHLDLKKQSVI